MGRDWVGNPANDQREMKHGSPDKNDESRIGRDLNGRMDTHKHPIVFGKVDQPNCIRKISEISYENEHIQTGTDS